MNKNKIASLRINSLSVIRHYHRTAIGKTGTLTIVAILQTIYLLFISYGSPWYSFCQEC